MNSIWATHLRNGSTALRPYPSPPTYEVTLESCPRAAARAREAAAEFLADLRPAAHREAADTVALVVSELVTNSVRHAGGATCSLRLAVCGDAVMVSVADGNSAPPVGRNPDVDGEGGGFGWPMVRRLALATSVCVTPQGKTVHALLPCRVQCP
ncbi:ATP-binding protein [Streptomyces gilvosporeus]|uniref:ATP-binding protein n=1 Tax=Streptomyces gilvosporeus TaxID=553510 RepID=UPI001F402DE5|nr:ATP-binding protein [Streptomyces gilvosporeus]